MAAGPRLGIDFGTSHTVALLAWPDGRVRPLLFDGSPLLPSSVYAQVDGAVLVGRDAVHAARVEPARFEASPKRRIDDGTVLLGEREVTVPALIGAVLTHVAQEATRVAGGPVSALTLTHPAAWGVSRRLALMEGAKLAGLPQPSLMPEPVAAAHYFAGVLRKPLEADQGLLVYDFGGGTFDASIVTRAGEGFDVRAVDGIDDLGGLDLDALIVDYAKQQLPDADVWARLEGPQTTEDRRYRRLLWDDARIAKEMLSRTAATGLHVPILAADLNITRDAFEERARPLLEQTVRTTSAVVRWAGLDKARLAGIFLVGGSSRIPLVATLLERELGMAPTMIEQPELVVAEGSLRAWVSVAPSTGQPADQPNGGPAPASGGPGAGLAAGPGLAAAGGLAAGAVGAAAGAPPVSAPPGTFQPPVSSPPGTFPPPVSAPPGTFQPGQQQPQPAAFQQPGHPQGQPGVFQQPGQPQGQPGAFQQPGQPQVQPQGQPQGQPGMFQQPGQPQGQPQSQPGAFQQPGQPQVQQPGPGFPPPVQPQVPQPLQGPPPGYQQAYPQAPVSGVPQAPVSGVPHAPVSGVPGTPVSGIPGSGAPISAVPVSPPQPPRPPQPPVYPTVRPAAGQSYQGGVYRGNDAESTQPLPPRTVHAVPAIPNYQSPSAMKVDYAQPPREEIPAPAPRPRRNIAVPVLVVVLVLALGLAGYVVFQDRANKSANGPGATQSSSAPASAPAPTTTPQVIPAYQREERPGWVPDGWKRMSLPSIDKIWYTQDEEAGGKCTATTDELHVTTKVNGLTGCTLQKPLDVKLADSGIEAKVHVTSGCAGMWLRTGSRGYTLGYCANGYVRLHRLADSGPGKNNLIEEWYVKASEDTYVAFAVAGDALVIYAGGEQVGRVSDQEIRDGRTNLGAFSTTGDAADVTFSDVRVFTPQPTATNTQKNSPAPTRSGWWGSGSPSASASNSKKPSTSATPTSD
ncbi:Hsp70 family protein [Dactylosporangium sp. AC04546]|uniref:Hsp70 family protein n=1 Tax=Dactylosporangium sp. AC04546 TaxID=2862460 RepID=UPI001EE0583D|nr:Hsp70 family protein [Dactylosporangium sp. AC04546]WVK82285.1 Hsp70 family protein [Dactylosporangium sp. AC04546]